jgi:SAM-dependent methyltransferase
VTGGLLQREQYAKGGIGRWYWDLRDERILSCIGPEKDILDLGCGEGITLEKILRRFPDRKVLGFDYAEEKVRICKEHHLPARQGSAYALDLEDHSWDCCLLLEVIEHLEERRAFSPHFSPRLALQGGAPWFPEIQGSLRPFGPCETVDSRGDAPNPARDRLRGSSGSLHAFRFLVVQPPLSHGCAKAVKRAGKCRKARRKRIKF